MKEIVLTQGKVALVDDEDYERVMSVGKWCAIKADKAWYVRHNNGKNSTYLHRFIMNAPDDVEVDHEDLNGLNNQRSNLRLATGQQNKRNNKKRSHNTSGFKGVSFYKRTNRFRSTIAVDQNHIHLGYFDDPVEAARAYDRAALKYFGEFARTNESMGLL